MKKPTTGSEMTEREGQIEEKISLNEHRLLAVLSALKDSGANRVVDLGCGEGKLLRVLCDEKQFTEIIGMDVSPRRLMIAEDRLNRTTAGWTITTA